VVGPVLPGKQGQAFDKIGMLVQLTVLALVASYLHNSSVDPGTVERIRSPSAP
jgi:hypothetical protein